MRTHDLPATFGLVHWQVTAASDAAVRRLLDRFVATYADTLLNPNWGEQARARPGNRFEATMTFQGLDEATARAAWQPHADFVAKSPEKYRIDAPMLVAALPAAKLWDGEFLQAHMPGVIQRDDRPGAPTGRWWWTSNTDGVGAFWHGDESAWLPASLLAVDRRKQLVDAWIDASRHWSMTFRFNKGLAGAPDEAIARSRETAMNPQVLDAFALAIIAIDESLAYAGLPPSDLADARRDLSSIRRAMTALRQAAPGAGIYLSECDYSLSDWQTACWGDHARRLSAITARYDPDDLFVVHQGIGSERWNNDGFSQKV